ncbi:tRNA pseudouridine(13) synthase TruD [Marinobacter lacisalsi]|uniref:tRNA pseudouridine synthase D n=1 Tax=Marinobacter lacisalsi TaxID=475979 RepID=A0ABV8QI15_9GAMM
MSRWQLDWPVPGGAPEASAHLKSIPEDFRVTELLDTGGPIYEPDSGRSLLVPGQGEHLLIYLEKTGDNTPWVAQRLGELAGCGDSGVGYSGLKDRHAVTRQWFSVQRPGLEADDEAFIQTLQQHWQVLAVARRGRKLRRGEHYANRFRIRLRAVTGDPAGLEQRLGTLAREGCPNYFGLQRFGHDGNNLDRAVAMASRPARRRRGRKSSGGREGLYFSAARSWLFNEVLAERVAQGNWLQRLPGEPHEMPTGPLWGDGGTMAEDMQGALERDVVARSPEIEAVFASTRMAPERRPLRLLPTDLEWTHTRQDGDRSLGLSFTLTPGQYATTMLSSVIRLISAP